MGVMASPARADYESLPFLNVFTPEYAKDPLGTIAALGGGHAMARSPRGLECLSYDLSWELLRDERFPVGFEELLTMCGLPTDGSAYHYFAHNTAALSKATNIADSGACWRRCSARPRSNGPGKWRDRSSRNCSMESKVTNSTSQPT